MYDCIEIHSSSQSCTHFCSKYVCRESLLQMDKTPQIYNKQILLTLDRVTVNSTQ